MTTTTTATHIDHVIVGPPAFANHVGLNEIDISRTGARFRTIRATTYCEEPGECRLDQHSRVLFQRKVEALKHSSAGHRRGNAAACQASRSAASVSGRFGEVIAVQVRNSSPPGRRSTIHQPS